MASRQWTCIFLSLLWAFAQQPPSPSPSLAGEWQGAVGRQHLMLRVQQTPGAPLKGSFVNVEAKSEIAVDTLTIDDQRRVALEIKDAGATFDGRLSADGSEIAGTLHQGSANLPLVFRRPGAAAAAFTLKPVTKGRVRLEPCRAAGDAVEALCGSYEVFENRQARAGRRIALNVMIIPAKADAPMPDPLFAFAGGPGESATMAFPPIGYILRVREQRDVVLIDQRGTGKSNPLECQLVNDDPRAVLAPSYDLDAIRACRAASDRKADTTQYTTSIAADDADEVREALGYQTIDVLGGSYGARAALVYLRRHGEHVRTLTVSAVAGTDFLIPLPFAKALQSSIDGIISLCDAAETCRTTFPKLRERFHALLARLQASPAEFDVHGQHVTLTRESFLSKLRSLLYVPQIVSGFPILMQHASDGDWLPYAGAVLQLRALIEGDVARGASFAVICAEDVPGYTPKRIRAATAGTDLGDAQARRYQEYCKAWGPAGKAPKDFYAPVRSRVPALLISGGLDPATPPDTARAAAVALSESRSIVVKEGTHGTGSTCVDNLIAEFVARGSAKDLDVSCVDRIHLPPFVTK
jgi:pimeloyl-ACP methyl ester carboxylesterase